MNSGLSVRRALVRFSLNLGSDTLASTCAAPLLSCEEGGGKERTAVEPSPGHVPSAH